MTADGYALAASPSRSEERSLLGRLVDHIVSRQALRRHAKRTGADYERAFVEEPGREAAERIAEQSAEAPGLLLDLLGLSFDERRALLEQDARFRSAPLAALVIDQARQNPEFAAPLARTACLILDQVGEEGRGLRVSAQVTLAEAQRLRADLLQAEALLLSAQEQLRQGNLPWESAELCVALARVRWEQTRFEEAFALGERAARLYDELGAEPETARAWLEAGRWNVALGDTRNAALCFALALRVKANAELRLAATRGLVQQLLLRGEPELALEVLQEVQRGSGFSTAQAAVLQSLEGQVLLRLVEVDKAHRLLEEAFAALLGSELRADTLLAGLALLVAGAPPETVAPRLVGLVPALWREELGRFLDDVTATGRVRPEQLATLEKFLDLPEQPT